jgi:hypothetical protein
MNYKRHYELLIERAKGRRIDDYTEKHHIIPRCMGGSDDLSNLVELTPEEHYVAHQLLVKMYPTNHALIKAAAMMVPTRPSNKLYGWIRRKLSLAMSDSQSGKGNSQYGTQWIYNIDLKISKKVPKDFPLEKGWYIGRVIDFDKKRFITENNGIIRKKSITKTHRTKEEYKIDRRNEAKKMAYDLFEQFLNSEYDSITEFAKSINTSQPRLSMLWGKYVVEFIENKKHGKSFKK